MRIPAAVFDMQADIHRLLGTNADVDFDTGHDVTLILFKSVNFNPLFSYPPYFENVLNQVPSHSLPKKLRKVEPTVDLLK